MTTTITYHLPDLYPKQRAAFVHDERIGVCEASTKAGKTMGAHIWQLHQALEVAPGCAHLWLSPVYSQARMQGFDRMCRMLTRADPGNKTCWVNNRTDLWVQLPNGSRIWYKSADKPDSIFGADYASAVMDEATRMKPEAWYAVRTTLTATEGPVRIIGNVKGRHNWAYLLARKAEAGTDNMHYSKLVASDAVEAGVLSAAEIEEAKAQLPEHVFNELYLAIPSDDGGNPFGLQHIAACVIDELRSATDDPNIPLPVYDGNATTWPIAFGVDLAKSQDWTVVVGLDADGNVCRFQRWQRVPWDETERRIIALVGSGSALIDATGVGDPIVERLQRSLPQVEGFIFTSNSKQRLMEGLAVAIQGEEVGYPDGVLRQELDVFEYEQTRTGVRYTAPDGLHDDCVCALALAVQCKLQHRPVSVSVVSVAGGGEQINDEPIAVTMHRLRENPDFGYEGNDRW